MTQANLNDRFVRYLEMATKAHEAARSPTADLQARNLYVWIAKSWEMLALDELEKLRSASRDKQPRRHQRIRSVPLQRK